MTSEQAGAEEIFGRLVAAEFEAIRRGSPEVIEFDHGWAAVNGDLPLVWDANLVAVTDPDASPERVAEFAEEVLGGRGLEHRRLYVAHTDAGAGQALVESLRGLDERWSKSAETYLVLAGQAEKSPASTGRSASGDELLEARRELAGAAAGEHWTREAEDQLLAHEENLVEGLDCIWFAAGEPPEGFCQLLSHPGGIGQIEHVGTMERSRGRGLASAAVIAASGESVERGDALTYVVADADDWPRHLYERLGFSAVGTLSSATIHPPLKT